MSPRAGWDHNHLRPTRWCVFISGRGSNLAALLEKSEIDVRLVLTTDPLAAGCAKARRHGVIVETIPFVEEGSKKIDWHQVDQRLRARGVEAIFLLGFMRIVPAAFIARWPGAILNLHPSLLPKYPGLNSIARAVQACDDIGATIHEVVPEVDAGPLLSARVSSDASEVSRLVGQHPASALETLETFVHIDEQRLVKEIVDVWRPSKIS